jgi:hypothetical protein
MDFTSIPSLATKAFDRIDKTLKVDADLETYGQLDEAGFSALAEQYGQEEVAKYIKTMEYRRLNNGKDLS